MAKPPQLPVESSHNLRNTLLAGGATVTMAAGGFAVHEALDNPDHTHVRATPAQAASEMHDPPTLQQFIAAEKRHNEHRKQHSQPKSPNHRQNPKPQTVQTIEVSKQTESYKSYPMNLPKPETHEKQTEQPGLRELNLDVLDTISPEAQATIEKHSAYITYPDGGWCSGFVIYDENDEPIGVRTAQHCSFLNKDGHLQQQPDGSYNLNFDAPLVVYLGTRQDYTQKAGTISEIALNGPDGATNDQVIAAFEGHSIDEVVARDAATRMPNQEVESLKTGDVLTDSGHPGRQEHGNGPIRRQDLRAIVLGYTIVSPRDSGQKIRTLALAFSQTLDKATCSPGISGSGIFRETSNSFLGVMTAGFDESNPEFANEKIYYSNFFKVKLTDKIKSICFVSTQAPDMQNGGITAKVVVPEIPAEGTTPITDIQPATPIPEIFKDPTVEWYAQHFFEERQVVDGVVHVNRGPKSAYTIEDAGIHYDPATAKLLLAGRNKSDGSLFVDVFYRDQAAEMISIYKSPGQEALAIFDSQGELQASDDKTQYTDQQGRVIGKFLNGKPQGEPAGRIAIKDGRPTIEAPFDVAGNIARAKEMLNDESAPKTSFKGLLAIGTITGEDTLYVENPVVIHQSDDSVVAFYTVAGEPIASFFPSAESMKIFSHDPASMEANQVTGPLTYQEDPTKSTSGALMGSDGQPMAQLLAAKPYELGFPFSASYQDGKYVFTPLSMK